MLPILPRSILLISAVQVLSVPCLSQAIDGTVRDASTRTLLPAASIRIAGSDQGTISNADGKFRIALPAGEHHLAVSYVGYRPETLSVRVPGTAFLDVRLQPLPVQMAEVVVLGEDPARAIMRKVIARKKKWMGTLESYTLEAFTRQVLRKDTVIASISESYTTGFWKKGDTLREIVNQKRQTENVPEEQNFASVGRILNFYDDEIRLADYRFIGPTSEEAFEYYDFHLESTRASGARKIFLISLNPNSRTTPLFRGMISVVDKRFVLASVDVEPNEAFSIPLIPDVRISYRQQFAPINKKYWLPVDIRIKAEINISLVFISFPPMRFESVSSIYDYSVNADVPDTLFQRRKRLYEDSSASVMDTTFWAEHDVLPLTLEQETAFAHIDSTQTLNKVFQPSTPVGDLDNAELSALKYIDARFTRVEGAYLGLKASVDSIMGNIEVTADAGYGFADRRGQAGISGTWWSKERSWSAGIEAFSKIAPIYDEGRHFSFENSISALMYKNDYFDYYRTGGGRVFVRYHPSKRAIVEIGLLHEEHRTAVQSTNFSIFSRSKRYRRNPTVDRGRLRSITAGFSYSQSDVPLGLIIEDQLDIGVELSNSTLGSEFDFLRSDVRGTYRLDTFLGRSPFPAYIAVALSAGWSTGTLPVQRHFTPETQSSSVGPFGTLRGASVKEFAGDRFVSLTVEHNFRNAPFLWLGIPFLYEQGWELVAFASAMHASSSGTPSPLGESTRGVYSEFGIGLNHLFKLFRADLTYRLYAPKGVSFTFSIGQLI